MSYLSRELEAKIVELRRTIQFLLNTMSSAADEVNTNPALATMILKDAVNDKRYEFK